MSEDKAPYGAEAREWAKAAQELRALMESAGLSQIAAAEELDVSERVMREYCSGRVAVPRAVLYAMRWVVDHVPNRERWIQAHWKKAGLTVSKGDKFACKDLGDRIAFYVNGAEEISGTLDELLARGLVSVHTSYSSDRFRLPTFTPSGKPKAELWIPVPAGQPLSDGLFFSEDRDTAETRVKEGVEMELWRAERVK